MSFKLLQLSYPDTTRKSRNSQYCAVLYWADDLQENLKMGIITISLLQIHVAFLSAQSRPLNQCFNSILSLNLFLNQPIKNPVGSLISVHFKKNVDARKQEWTVIVSSHIDGNGKIWNMINSTEKNHIV